MEGNITVDIIKQVISMCKLTKHIPMASLSGDTAK